MNNFFADSLRVFSSNIFSLLLSFLSGIIIARCLGPENKGLYTSILVIPLLVQSLCEMGLRQATTFYLGKKYLIYNLVIRLKYLKKNIGDMEYIRV